VIAVGGLTYAIGGVNADNAFTPAVEVYNAAKDSWTTAAPMPTARPNMAAAVIDGIIYVAGGRSLAGALSTVEAYDPKTNRWNSRASLPMPRDGATAAVIDGELFCLGGTNNDKFVSNVVIYSPKANTWAAITSVSTEREGFVAIQVGRAIYTIGGSSGLESPAAVAAVDTLIPSACLIQRN